MSKLIKPTPLKHRELIKKLNDFGITENKSKGKGSHRILTSNSGNENGKYHGPQIPLPFHGENEEYPMSYITAILGVFIYRRMIFGRNDQYLYASPAHKEKILSILPIY